MGPQSKLSVEKALLEGVAPILRIEVERIQLYAPPRISCYVLFQSVKQIEPVVGSECGRKGELITLSQNISPLATLQYHITNSYT